MSPAAALPREALLCVESYAGRIEQRVRVVGETRTRYRVRADFGRVRLGGGFRWLEPGDWTLVPKRAVRFTKEVEVSK